MEKFQVIQPSPALAPYVKHYWFLKTTDKSEVHQRIIPTGTICLVFHRGTNMFSLSNHEMQPTAFITGQSNKYYDLMQLGSVDMISVTFQPHGANAFFPFPMYELAEKVVSVGDLSDINLIELQDKLCYISDLAQCVWLIESFLLKKLYLNKSYNFGRMHTALQSIHGGQTDVRQLAQICCLSYKQFRRVFHEYVGSNPKDFLQVIRFQRALYILQLNRKLNFAELAAECGYFDQPHLIRDFKVFSGYTPREYLSVCQPYSDYFA